MVKRNWVVVLIAAVFTAAVVACAGSQMSKSEGGASAQNPAVQEQKAPAGSGAQAGDYDFENVRFDFNKSGIRPEDRKILAGHAGYLLKNRKANIIIEGYCDERGSAKYNIALGERRAKEAKKYLVNAGVSAKRIKTVSFGKEKPIDPAHNEVAWAKNRRDQFVLE
jgi:peptidoglycan-associated lipoprotein